MNVHMRIGSLALMAIYAVSGLAATPGPGRTVTGLSEARALALGERMYRQGILPNGTSMQAVVGGGKAVPGLAFTCASCHLRSGVGTSDEGVAAQAINGPSLTQPVFRKLPKVKAGERVTFRLKGETRRPAYTDATLAKAIRQGVDPSGRHFNPVMPSYRLRDRDLSILIHYLKQLSATFAPGVTETTLAFATIVTEEVSKEDREAMLLPLDNFVLAHNRRAENFDAKMYVFGNGPEMMLGYRQITLDRWELKGPARTWRDQLEAYHRAKPVFALLGGITYGEWQPIHTFCEDRHLPCLFPITDLPALSDRDWYTVYLTRGFDQEGESAANFLKGSLSPEARILQVVQDTPQGRALATGFQAAWRSLEGGPVTTVRLPAGATLKPGDLEERLRNQPAQAVLLWTGADAYPALEAFAGGNHPDCLVMSSRYLKEDLNLLPGPARGFTYLTYPFRHPDDEPKYSQQANSLLAGYTTYHPENRISTRVFTLTQVLTTALVDLDRNFYRDAFLDVIGMQPDRIPPDFERVTFSQSQRYVSRGCYLMQLTPGSSPTLVKKSGWLAH